MRRYVLPAVMTMLICLGCAPKEVAPPEQLPLDSQKPQEQKLQEKKADELKIPAEKVTDQKIAKVESGDAPAKKEEISGLFKDIFFEYDRYDIRDDAKGILRSVADHLIKNTGQTLLIEGHCDERGTSEYNLGLGDRRARSVRDYIVSLGIPSSRIETISYGKEKQVCSEAREECWARNRRAHFVLVKEKK